MYSRISNKSYRETPFSDKQSSVNQSNSYTYYSIKDLSEIELPENSLQELVGCRTVGIIQSYHGKFYVYDLNPNGGVALATKIRVSVLYLNAAKSSAAINTIVMPCPVQIFGSIRWHSQIPVVYVKIMQVLSVPKALQIKDIMDQLIIFKAHEYATHNLKHI